MAPGYFATEANTAMVADPDVAAWLARRTSLGRWGRPTRSPGPWCFWRPGGELHHRADPGRGRRLPGAFLISVPPKNDRGDHDMSKFTAALAVAVLALGGYRAFRPHPRPARGLTSLPRDAGYTGSHARNSRLTGITRIPLARDQGPEHIVAHDGWIYTGLTSGAVVRLRADAAANAQPETVLNTGGHSLGLD